MKERLLVLGIAEPHTSRGYGGAVCVAGITWHGDFRRIYSFPLKYYVNKKFRKYQYIRYELLDSHGDSRPESRKMDPESLELLDFAERSTINRIIKDNVQTLDYLQNRTRISLGIIKPDISDLNVDYRNYKRNICFNRLRAGSNTMHILPFWPRFSFNCERRRNCRGHNILCEDMEIGNYYRRVYDQMHGRSTKAKVKDKISEFAKKNDTYFLMGTHRQYRDRWLIISLLSPDANRFYGRKG